MNSIWFSFLSGMFFMMTVSVCTGTVPVVGRNSIQSGNKSVHFYKGGVVLVTGKGIRCHTSLNMGTSGGYFSFGSKKVLKSSFSSPEKGVFLYKATVPEDKKGTEMEVSQEVSLTPMGSLEFQIQWKAADKRNLRDFFYILRFPMAHFKNQKVPAGSYETTVLNQSKYGFFNKSNLPDPKLVLYAWDDTRRFSIQCEGKVKIIMQSVKDKDFLLRIYPDPGSNVLRFTLLFQ